MPLSILHIAAPATVGGLESVVQTLAVGHHRQGHQVRVVAVIDVGQSNHPFIDALTRNGVEVIPLAIQRWGYLTERRLVRELCSRFRPDVVHTHGERPDVLDAGIARSLNLPTVTTLHGSSKLGGVTILHEWLQLLALRRFDAVAVVSRPLAASIAKVGVPEHRIHLVPNCWSGKTSDLDRLQARCALGLSPQGFVVGWVGRIIPAKGADIFLSAVAMLRDLPLCVAVIGGGPGRAALKAQAAFLGLDGAVTFHGEVADAVKVFPAFDLFVLSSRTEGTPMVLFEAMAAGVPIVAAAVGGVPDVITSAESRLVEPEDPAALAGAIRAAYDDFRGSQTRAAAARQRLVSEFSTAPWLARYEAIYQHVRAPK